MRKGRTREGLPVFIFDLGGVVIKWKSNNPIFDHIARIYGVPLLEMRREFEETLPRLEAGQVEIREFLTKALARFGKRLRKGDSPEELWTLPFARLATLRVGTVELVASMRRKGYRVFLFSNTSMPHARFVRKVGWDRLFDGFLTSCELGSLKPSGDAYGMVLERINASPAGAAFVDDKEENVRGAREFGLRWAIRFTSVAELRRDIAGVEAEVRRDAQT
jgi:putative hydrolase of the HAD superfamily